jgi:4,5-DOPA dioxygenase extradiol
MPALPALFVGHGAPTFTLDPGAAGAALAAAPDRWPRPRAVLSVSAHWKTSVPTLGGATRPETVHDFWGFPQPLYDLQYPAPGDPDLARRAAELLGQAGLSADIAPHRGLDHAVWIPLRLMYPGAEVPVVPMSIQSRLGPEHHLHLGQALAPLLTQGVLLVASGNLTHNLGHWHQTGQVSLDYVADFSNWLRERLAGGDVAGLLDYRRIAPGAREAHPTEEHLLPLYAALGAAGTAFRAEPLYRGVSERILAMDSYALWPSTLN